MSEEKIPARAPQEIKETGKAKGEKKRSVTVIGHRNPDTDSICSAIAYAYFKNQTDPEKYYQAARAGHVSVETKYVLNYFKADTPMYISNLGTRVKDMEIRRLPGVRSDLSIRNAWLMLRESGAFTLPITDEDGHLHGMITINDIARSYMEEHDSAIVSAAHTPYRNILDTLEAEMVVGDPDASFDSGKVVIAAANPDIMENYIDEHDMVILGNRYESQLCAIEMNAGCIVVCLGAPVSKTIQLLAREHGTAVIVTPLDTYQVARLINQSMPVEFFMSRDNLTAFRLNDYTEQIRDVMSKKRFRDFPVLDRNDRYVGMISRRNLLGVRRRAAILVDHNEESQAVANITEAEILEIIDHHRLGSLETMGPVFFRNQPVGCTATIIYQMFREQNVEIRPQIAGLLCSAILSDTLIFRSPTCTETDRRAAEDLAAIAGIDCEQFGRDMFSAGSNLRSRTPEDIFNQDFKEFDFGDVKIGIAQINSMSAEDSGFVAGMMKEYLPRTCRERGLDMAFFMMTDILEEASTFIFSGTEAQEVARRAFPQGELRDGTLYAKEIVSRKKQVVPGLMEAINTEDSSEE